MIYIGMNGCVFPQFPRLNHVRDAGDTRTFTPGEKVCVRVFPLFHWRDENITYFPARYVRPEPGRDGKIQIHIVKRLTGGDEMWQAYYKIGKYDSSPANKAKLRSMKNQLTQYPENVFGEIGKFLGPDPKIFTRKRRRRLRQKRKSRKN